MAAKKPKAVVTLADLTPDPQNARAHNPRNIGQVQSSLQKYGAARSIVIDENGQIIAGHGVVEAAALAGIEKVQVVDGDGETIIAVRRSGLTKKQKQELGVADNRGAELATWNPVVLADLAGEIDLSQFWNDTELSELLDEATGNDAEDPGADVDRAAELLEKWGCAVGDLWQIGRHRLLVGDCTVRANVKRLMGGERADMVFTSPPYNSDSELHGSDNFRGSLYLDKNVDALSSDDFIKFNHAFFAALADFVKPEASVFFNISYNRNSRSEYLRVVGEALALGYKLHETIVWKKHGMPNPASVDVLTRDFEFVFLLSRADTYKTTKARGEVRSNVWDISNLGAQIEQHKACFPVELPKRGIEWATVAGDVVYDGFNGTGTTLLACEQTGRIGRGIELSPAYAAVTLERLTGLGLDAHKVD